MDCIPMPSAPMILGLLTGARWLHMYRPRRFQWTWFGVNQTSGSWIRVTAKFGRDDRQTHGGRCFQWSSPLAECFALICVVLVSNLIILLASAHWWSGYACPPQTHAKQYPHNRCHTNEVSTWHAQNQRLAYIMMTSSNDNIFHVTGPLWRESTVQRWIPLTMASDTELWCFLWSASERLRKQSRRRWFKTSSRSLYLDKAVDSYDYLLYEESITMNIAY